MGNCTFRGFGAVEAEIKVITSNGGIMELYAPITAECVTNEFPGQGIFRGTDFFSQPLLHNEELQVGELYYLLPLNTTTTTTTTSSSRSGAHHHRITRENLGDLRPSTTSTATSTSTTTTTTGLASSSLPIAAPYRMSVESQGVVLKRGEGEVFPRSNSSSNNGVWKVKLVISPEQLSEILSQEESTEALIESLRTVAKCGTGVSSVANSDQWSVSSSWKAPSEHLD